MLYSAWRARCSRTVRIRMNKQNGKDGGETFIMEDIRYIAWNLGTQTLVANKNTTKFSQLIYVNGNTYIISNASVTAVKTVSNSNYFNQFAKTGTQADDYFYF